MNTKTEEQDFLLRKDNISYLFSNKWIAPSFLSYLIFLSILPATVALRSVKKLPITNNSETNLVASNSFIQRSMVEYKPIWKTIDYDGTEKSDYQIISEITEWSRYNYTFCILTHQFQAIEFEGLETLKVYSKEPNTNKYSVVFGGNMQDSMILQVHKDHIEKDENRNYIFWNYPGVAGSAGSTSSPEDLINAGVKQVMRLINIDKIPAQDITLDGHSLGGAVAIGVAEVLHANGHYVNLKIDRSFSCVSKFVPSHIENLGLNIPMITAPITIGLAGMSLGIVCAGIASKIALTLETSKNYKLGCLNKLLANCIYILGNTIGVILAITGLLAGVVIGGIIGSILSSQHLVTATPYNLPMQWAFSFVLNLSLCEMNSKKVLDGLLESDDPNNEAKFSGITAKDDEVILYSASLQEAFKKDSPVNGSKSIAFEEYDILGHNQTIPDTSKPETSTYPTPTTK
ncbi:MAG: hypothetical protein P1U74_06995 [Legionellaceae bacterium]|nr:hypothetical protein [Legionellaceae bacterium]